MKVKELASEQPEPLRAENSLKEAGERIRSLYTERVPVVSGDRLVGALEGKYPERKAGGLGHDAETTLVREFIVRKVYYCGENQSVNEAAEIMRKHHLDYLPVVDDKTHVIGILTQRDLQAKRRRASK